MGPCRKWPGLGQACCFDQFYEPWLFTEHPAPTLPPRAVSCQWHSEILAVPGESAAGPQPHFLQLGPWPWLLGTEQPLRQMLGLGVGPETERMPTSVLTRVTLAGPGPPPVLPHHSVQGALSSSWSRVALSAPSDDQRQSVSGLILFLDPQAEGSWDLCLPVSLLPSSSVQGPHPPSTSPSS